MTLAALFFALILQDAGTSPALPDPDEVEALQREAREAEEVAAERAARADAIAQEIATLQQRLIDAAERVRVREAAASEADARLAELEMEEAALRTALVQERASLSRVLGALQRMETGSPPALAVNPEDAAEAARAAGLLANIAPQLEARAEAVRARLRELETLRERLLAQGAQVDDAVEALDETRAEVEALIAERRDAERRLRAESEDLSRRAAEIAGRAQTLEDLLSEIRRFAAAEPRLSPRRTDPPIAGGSETGIPVPRLRPEPMDAGSLVAARPLRGEVEGMRFSDARGQLRPPAFGPLVTGFRAEGRDGQARDGIWFETRPRAQVVAPFDGVVVFAGDFQALEGVLLINTADGYTLVIGGMAALYAREGQSVLAGEPIGTTPDRENPAPRVYFGILRSTDQPEDPENWLRPEFRRG